MSGRLHGRSVVVTGAGSGIGNAIARHLAVNEGAKVVVTGRRAEPLEQLADEVGCVVCTGDMTSRVDVRKVLGTAVEEQQVEVLVEVGQPPHQSRTSVQKFIPR